MVTVSTIIPTYNRSDLVCEAIRSVLAQDTSHQIEVIVVDDGSVDETQDALAEFGDRIVSVRQNNRGMNAARNRGIEMATGEYIAFLDSDDVWLPYKLELELAVLENWSDVGFVFSDFYILRGADLFSRGLSTWRESDEDFCAHLKQTALKARFGNGTSTPIANAYKCDIYRQSLIQPVVLPSTAILRASVARAMGPLQIANPFCGDWEYFAEASKRFGSAYLDLETAKNRSHDDAVRLMRSDASVRIQSRLESIERLWIRDQVFSSSNGKLLHQTKCRLLKSLFKLHAYSGRPSAAREIYRQLREQCDSVALGYKVLRACMSLPGFPQVAAVLKRLLR